MVKLGRGYCPVEPEILMPSPWIQLYFCIKAAKKVKLDKACDELSHAVALQKWESKGKQLEELMGLAVPGTDGYNDLKDQYIAHLKNMPKDPTADDAS